MFLIEIAVSGLGQGKHRRMPGKSVPGDHLDPGIKPTSLMSPALSGRFFTIGTTGEGSPCSAYPQRNSKITPMYESPEYGPYDGDREWSDEPQGAWAWPLSPVPPQAMLLCLPGTCGLSIFDELGARGGVKTNPVEETKVTMGASTRPPPGRFLPPTLGQGRALLMHPLLVAWSQQPGSGAP